MDQSSHQVYRGGSYPPDSLTLPIGVPDPGDVTCAVFFYRLQDVRSHELRDFSQGEAMNWQGGGEHFLTLRGILLPAGRGSRLPLFTSRLRCVWQVGPLEQPRGKAP